jgi:hypothetical protein
MVRTAAAALLSVLMLTSAVHAQPPSAAPNQPAPGIRKSMEHAAFQLDPAGHQPLIAKQAQFAAPLSPTARKARAGVIGALAGLSAGGYVGGKLDSNCRCNDPGIKGAIIGAPIGALLGAIAGVKLASR